VFDNYRFHILNLLTIQPKCLVRYVTRVFFPPLILASFLFINVSQAASLGKLTILSSSGQPFRGEVELMFVAPAEASSLSARLAPRTSFNRLGISYHPALELLRFSVERTEGKRIVRITSMQPVHESNLHLLLELSSSQSRMQRSYTMRLDSVKRDDIKKEADSTDAPAPVKEPEQVRDITPVRETVVIQSDEKADDTVRQPARALSADMTLERKITLAPEAAKPEYRPGSATPDVVKKESTYLVNKGDTLRNIVRRFLPDDVSLEQILVATYRNNPEAFIKNNMNLLKEGATIKEPEKRNVEKLHDDTARKIVRGHNIEFHRYREQMARNVAVSPAVSGKAERGDRRQSASGQIARKQPEAATMPQQADRLELSRGEIAKDGRKYVTQEEKIVLEKALEDAKSRIHELEKNVTELQDVLDTVKRDAHTQIAAATAATEAVTKEAAAKEAALKEAITRETAAKEAAMKEAAENAAKANAQTNTQAIPPPVVAPPSPSESETDMQATGTEGSKAKSGITALGARSGEIQPIEKPGTVSSKAAKFTDTLNSWVDKIIKKPVWSAGAGGVLALLALGVFLLRKNQNTQPGKAASSPRKARSSLAARASKAADIDDMQAPKKNIPRIYPEPESKSAKSSRIISGRDYLLAASIYTEEELKEKYGNTDLFAEPKERSVSDWRKPAAPEMVNAFDEEEYIGPDEASARTKELLRKASKVDTAAMEEERATVETIALSVQTPESFHVQEPEMVLEARPEEPVEEPETEEAMLEEPDAEEISVNKVSSPVVKQVMIDKASPELPEEATEDMPEPHDDVEPFNFDFSKINLDLDTKGSKTTLDLGMQISKINLDLDAQMDRQATAEPEQELVQESRLAAERKLTPHEKLMDAKLELALAYMGTADKEGARELLEEIIAQGNEQQANEAKEALTMLA